MKLTFRKAILDDIPKMQRLFVDTIQERCKKDYSSQQIEVWASSIKKKDRWEGLVREQYVVLAEIENKLVGFGSLENGNYVDFMYVHKDHMRKGIAHQIFEELTKEAQRLGNAKLASDVSKTARPFFEQKGFKVIHENKNIIKGVEIINYRMEQ